VRDAMDQLSAYPEDKDILVEELIEKNPELKE
jgi:hypothetical protein